MKFRRHVRMLGGILDAAPFASVFFLLLMLVMIGPLIYTPGLHLELPTANDFPGTDKPTVTVAVDAANQIYFDNQVVTENELKSHLAMAVANSREPLTLVVKGDTDMKYGYFMRLASLASEAGIRGAHLATLPRLIAAPERKTSGPP